MAQLDSALDCYVLQDLGDLKVGGSSPPEGDICFFVCASLLLEEAPFFFPSISLSFILSLNLSLTLSLVLFLFFFVTFSFRPFLPYFFYSFFVHFFFSLSSFSHLVCHFLLFFSFFSFHSYFLPPPLFFPDFFFPPYNKVKFALRNLAFKQSDRTESSLCWILSLFNIARDWLLLNTNKTTA